MFAACETTSDEAWWNETFTHAVELERKVLQRVHEDVIARQTRELGASDLATLRSKAALASVLRDDETQLSLARRLAEEASVGAEMRSVSQLFL